MILQRPKPKLQLLIASWGTGNISRLLEKLGPLTPSRVLRIELFRTECRDPGVARMEFSDSNTKSLATSGKRVSSYSIG